jgi:hypothetical protein
MDMVWIQTSRFNQFLHFGHGYFPASSGERVKVTGGFAINQIAVRIGVMVESGVRGRPGFEGGGGLAENVACLE